MGSGGCPTYSNVGSKKQSRMGPRGCTMSGFSQPGDVHAAFGVSNRPGAPSRGTLTLKDPATRQCRRISA